MPKSITADLVAVCAACKRVEVLAGELSDCDLPSHYGICASIADRLRAALCGDQEGVKGTDFAAVCVTIERVKALRSYYCERNCPEGRHLTMCNDLRAALCGDQEGEKDADAD